MNRLTLREIECYDDYAKSLEDEFDMEEVNDVMYIKLKALEDIEEELGIDLYTLFIILKRGQLICKFRPMYDPKKTFLLSRKINSLYYDGCYYRLEINEDGDDGYIIEYDVYLKDYGITWALTREELENDK